MDWQAESARLGRKMRHSIKVDWGLITAADRLELYIEALDAIKNNRYADQYEVEGFCDLFCLLRDKGEFHHSFPNLLPELYALRQYPDEGCFCEKSLLRESGKAYRVNALQQCIEQLQAA